MVESLHTITTSRPATRPMPVMRPAAWMSSLYMPWAASGDSSKNGAPGSRRFITRSRGSSFPRARWRSRARFGPPSATAARRSVSSALSAPQALRLARAAFEVGSSEVWMAGTSPPLPSPYGVGREWGQRAGLAGGAHQVGDDALGPVERAQIGDAAHVRPIGRDALQEQVGATEGDGSGQH